MMMMMMVVVVVDDRARLRGRGSRGRCYGSAMEMQASRVRKSEVGRVRACGGMRKCV